MNSIANRLALASGSLFSACQIAALAYFIVVIAPHLPPLSAPPAEHGAFYTQYANENALVAFLMVLPMPLLAFFVAGVYHVLQRGVLATTALVTGTALSIVWPIGIVVAGAGQSMAQFGLDPVTVMTFDGIAQLMLALACLPRAAFLLATAVLVANRSKGMAISGYVLAALSALGTLALLSAEAYAITALTNLLVYVWLAVLSGMLVRRLSTTPRTQPEPILAAAA